MGRPLRRLGDDERMRFGMILQNASVPDAIWLVLHDADPALTPRAISLFDKPSSDTEPGDLHSIGRGKGWLVLDEGPR